MWLYPDTTYSLTLAGSPHASRTVAFQIVERSGEEGLFGAVLAYLKAAEMCVDRSSVALPH